MSTGSAILDSDFKYIDGKGNLLRSRTELSIAQMLEFLQIEYQYDYSITLKNGNKINVDFKTDKGIIEVIDVESDITKYKELKQELTDMKIIAMGHPKFAARLSELQDRSHGRRPRRTKYSFAASNISRARIRRNPADDRPQIKIATRI